MMPNRPVWLGHRDILLRDALFKNFRGLLTYGSPLERFCGLWSAMVPVNKQEDPFHESTEWVNVYDPTDPVGTWIEDFDPTPVPPAAPPRAGHTTLKPQNFPCRASPILLYSHLCYLNAPNSGSTHGANRPQNVLVNQAADWLVKGGSLGRRISDAPTTKTTFWMPRGADGPATHRLSIGRVIWRFVQAALVGVALTLLTVLSLRKIITPALNFLHLSFIVDGFTALAAWLGAKLSGIFGWLQTSLGLPADWSLSAHYPTVWEILVDSLLLWLLTALVVFVASLINNRRSANDIRELRARSDMQSRLRQD
jgi:hypothetical protein